MPAAGRSTLRGRLPALLRQGWPDEARRVAQEPVLYEASALARPRGRCLNAGCGEGLYSRFLESFAEVSEIVNLDVTMPRIAATRPDPRHTDAAGSLTELPLADGSCDWLLCTEVIEFVPDDRAVARELGRVLKPGAHALITVPTPPAPRVSADVRDGYTPAQLRELLAQGGLEVVWQGHCFHLLMRWFVLAWRWQHERLGGGRRSLMPRLAVLAWGHADRWLTVGRPWDLVVLARRT
ncbi:MAG TPA: class I SAM-dependent methyltransferase [Solirubrobacteraceae bacterium]|nr:class I SAM-dependent methyltransferase [Solirubrobacteraceae bacterium]